MTDDPTERQSLETTRRDVAAALTRGVLGACPFLGPVLSEAVNFLIPNQKLDRVIDWIHLLELQVTTVDQNLERIIERLRTEEGLDLFEDGVAQASRALSGDRRQHLANIIARSLTQDELKFAESKKLLNLFQELTDPEIIMLLFYSERQAIGSERLRELMNRYPEVLRPISREIGLPQDQIDKAALQDSYRNTLVRLGLLRENSAEGLTSLGRLLVRQMHLLTPE